MMRINDSIKNDRLSATPIMGYMSLVSNDMGHYFKLGAEIVAFSTEINDYVDEKGKKHEARFEMEHAMVATQTYMYLMNAALTLDDAGFEATYDFVAKEFKLLALDKAMEIKLTKADLQKKMQDTYNLITDRFYTRYANKKVAAIEGGIDFELIEMVSDGRTMGETYNINANGDIRIAQEFSKRQSKQNVNDAFSNRIKNAIKGKTKGMSTFDFDDTLARTKSGVQYTMENPSGKPAPQKKVIFMAGGPGSGKSNVVKQLGLEKQGFKIVNQDISLQWLAKNHGLPTDMRDFTPKQASKWGSLQWKARDIAQRKKMKFQGKGDGVVIDGTGASFASLVAQVKDFKRKGYDAQMIFVETSLKTAVARNKARKERSLKNIIVVKTHKSVEANKEKYKKEFGENFSEVNTDNLKQGDPMPKDIVDKLDKFTKGYIRGRLTAEEFANKGAELEKQGAKFDFSEFNEVIEGTKGPYLKTAIDRAKKYGTKDMFVLTARPQEAAGPIREFLKSQGLNIPIENITGLANSTGEAKANWMLQKFAEGFNDMYFVDDVFANVKAVKEVLDQLDVKSDIVQAKTKFSRSANIEFNEMLERNKGIDKGKIFSTA